MLYREVCEGTQRTQEAWRQDKNNDISKGSESVCEAMLRLKMEEKVYRAGDEVSNREGRS